MINIYVIIIIIIIKIICKIFKINNQHTQIFFSLKNNNYLIFVLELMCLVVVIHRHYYFKCKENNIFKSNSKFYYNF